MQYLIVNPSRYFRPHLPQKELFYRTLTKIFDEYNVPYDIVEHIHKNIANKKIIAFHTRNPDFFNVKMAHLPDWFYFDRRGFNGWSEYGRIKPDFEKQDTDLIACRFLEIQKNVIERRLTKLSQDNNEPLPICGDFIFVALQTLNDQVCRLMYTKWESLIKKLHKIPYNIVIKRHPNCRSSKIKALLNEYVDNKKIFLSNASIHNLLPACKGVITGNSGVGFEALIYLKPVFLYAHSDYKWACWTNLDFSLIKNCVQCFGEKEKLLIKKFVVDFLDNYLIHVYDEKSYLRRLKQTGIL